MYIIWRWCELSPTLSNVAEDLQWGPRAGFLWPTSVFLTQHMDQGKERYLFLHSLPYYNWFSFGKNIELNKNKHLYCKYALFYSLKWLSLFLQEHKKIVFFYPKETDIDTQIKHIGLCEAIVRFTEYVTHLNTQNPKLSFIQNKNYFNEHILISIDMLLYITEHFLISHAKVSTQPREDNSSWKQKRISGWLW